MTQHDADRPISEVLKRLGDDLSRLVRGEIALLKTEMQQNLTRLGTGAGLLGGAGVVGLFALEFLLLALMFGLAALGLTLWVSALLVAILLGIVAAVLAVSGRKTVASTSVAPQETIEEVKSDAAVIEQDLKNLRSR